MAKKEKYYITTSIPYLNAAPHLGFALEATLADVIARYKRLSGYETFFLTGTDEHGAKMLKAAEDAGLDPKKLVDGQTELYLNLLEKLKISNDDFIRTSDRARHWPGAQALWRKLKNSGDIYKGRYKGQYCVGHEAFITEKDLVNGVCAIHNKLPEEIEEENYFFKLSKYTAKIKKAILEGEFRILPEARKNEALNMLSEVGDISFSRPAKDVSWGDAPWGIPVPDDATQTMYVWCDALSNYISAIGYGTFDADGLPQENAERFFARWPAEMHVVGKDILKFHAIIWPAMLLSADLPLPGIIFVHGFINFKGQKMSKSVGNIADPFSLIAKYGSDGVRFYLVHEVPTFGDGDYSEEHFNDIYGGLLVNGIGNLLSRVLKMMESFSEIQKPDAPTLTRYPIRKNLEFLGVEGKQFSIEDTTPTFLVDAILWPKYHDHMKKYELGAAVKGVWAFLQRLDEYIEGYKPYKMLVSQPEDAKIILWHLAYSLASCAWMIKPFMPDTADKMLTALGVDYGSQESWTKFSAKGVIHLFPRIEKNESKVS